MSQEKEEEVVSGVASPKEVLIVEDDLPLASQWRRFLKREFSVAVATNKEETFLQLRSKKFPVVLLDLGLPPYPESPRVGLELLKELVVQDPLLKVIVITAHGQKEVAQAALSMGAYDFLVKPVDDEMLLSLLRRAAWRCSLESAWLSAKREELPTSMVLESEAMRRVAEEVRRVAPLEVNVLVEGESGTGKELVAQLIHSWSKRRGRPFVAVDCAAIPVNLGEAELFGAERGAYTGAVRRIEGKVAQAEGGTLFLDEIGEISWELQAKLLRFLETKEYSPLGGKAKKGDVRIIAATNRELDQEVERGKFRLDLFYRIGQMMVSVPPLRERKEDILPLARHFINTLSREFNVPPSTLSKEAEKVLLTYGYPGNVRELRNLISRALLLANGGVILPEHLGLRVGESTEDVGISAAKRGYDLPRAKRALEEGWIREALRRHDGKITPAARDLGIPRTTLYDLIKKYAISI